MTIFLLKAVKPFYISILCCENYYNNNYRHNIDAFGILQQSVPNHSHRFLCYTVFGAVFTSQIFNFLNYSDKSTAKFDKRDCFEFYII